MTRSWPGFDPRGRRGSREEAAQQEGNHRAAAKRRKVGTATAAADDFQFGTPWTTQHHTTISYHTEYIPIHFPFLDLDASPFYIS